MFFKIKVLYAERLNVIFLIVALSTFFLSHPVYAKELTHTFDSYEVACNNINTCQAVSYRFVPIPENELKPTDQIINVLLQRTGHSSSTLTIALAEKLSAFLGDDNIFTPNLVGKPMRLQIGEQSWDLGTFTTNQQKNSFISIPDSLVQSFLQASKKADFLILHIGEKKYLALLQGLTATLTFMDKQQNRVGTTSALILKGNKILKTKLSKPLSITPIIAPLKTKPNTRAKEKLTRLLKPYTKDCDSFWLVYDFRFYALDSKSDMVMILCSMGAYNANYRIFKVNRKNPNSIKLIKFFDPLNNTTEDLLTRATYPRSSGLLTGTVKGRGLGDCGTHTEWAWTGKQFILTREDTLTTDACLGGYPFLNVWQTQVRKPIEH